MEKRVVFYQCLIAAKVQERIGVFDVTYDDNGLPVRAEMPRFVGFHTTKDLVEFYDEIFKAILDRSALHCVNILDLDSEAWDGSHSFEPKTVLL